MVREDAIDSVINRIFRLFPEAGVITVGAMAAAYDQNREEADYYKFAAIDYFNATEAHYAKIYI